MQAVVYIDGSRAVGRVSTQAILFSCVLVWYDYQNLLAAIQITA